MLDSADKNIENGSLEKGPQSLSLGQPDKKSQETASGLKADWISGSIETPGGTVSVIRTELLLSDRLGNWKVRWGFGRMLYRIIPGLYAVGSPDSKSPVFISANFKLSFDRLRSQLKGIDGWILVLDTKGINVWCAAGKGTFGTDEIVHRVGRSKLFDIVTHRRLILPQLGAPGVAAHEVKERTGFRVVYGPVRVEDIPEFLDNGRKATSQMRQVNFTFRDRLVLVPVELLTSAKYSILAAACFLLLSGFGGGIYSLDRVASFGMVSALTALFVFIFGTILPQILLPWLPGRSFAVKGIWVSLILSFVVWWWTMDNPEYYRNLPTLIGWFFMILAIVSFITMNFTGSSTYTSLSGVLKEMKYAVPLQIAGATVGLVFWITGLLI